MSDMNSNLQATAASESDLVAPSRLQIAVEPQGWFGRFNEWFSERCSSILVKETRQALKSKHFLWSYFFLLLAAGVWTVLGLLSTGFGGDYSRAGEELLVGYWVLLGFPLALIVPFGAYRSLAREFEDGTIQLISITTMRPYQIVIGKFGSSILQMLTYLSVLAPCILFTYMLRGISLSQIVLGMLICVGGSICLTIVGLFLAGAIRSRALGVGVSVLYVLLLGWVYFWWCVISHEIASSGGFVDFDDPEFRLVFYCLTALFASTAILLLVSAAAQISFPSDNRSTGARIAMLLQQVLFISGVVAFLPPMFRQLNELCLVTTLMMGHYWLVMGLLMIGERASVSRRVQRTLPRSYFSRSAFSLFMPGSGRGFLFALANLWACSLLLILVCSFSQYLVSQEIIDQYVGRNVIPGGVRTLVSLSIESVVSTLVSCLFVTWFLSVIFIAYRFVLAKRFTEFASGVGPLVSLVSGSLFVASVLIASLLLHISTARNDARGEVSIWLVPNWYAATVDISQGSTYFQNWNIFLLFAFQAIVVIVFAIGIASRDLLQQPIAVPERVKIELAKAPKPVRAGESIEEIFGSLNPNSET